jgi:MFS family permease
MKNQKDMSRSFAMIATLYFLRGTFLPYIFQVIQSLSTLSFIQIGAGLTLFTIFQAATGPLAGSLLSARNSGGVRTLIPALLIAITGLTGLLKYTQISPKIGWSLLLAVLGISFTTLRIGFNTCLLRNTATENVRRVVSLRATVLNVGAFIGTVLSSYTIDKTGIELHAAVTLSAFLALHVGLLMVTKDEQTSPDQSQGLVPTTSLKEALSNRSFWSEALVLLAVYIRYGCWGTIIPKFAIDLYGSNAPVRWISATSLVTIIAFTFVFNALVTKKFGNLGKNFSLWPILSIVFFQISFLMLGFASNPAMLVAACFVFEAGEIFFTPLADISARRHLNGKYIGVYLGVLCLVDGIGRAIGGWVAFHIYDLFSKGSAGIQRPVTFWLTTAGALLVLSLLGFALSRLVMVTNRESTRFSRC